MSFLYPDFTTQEQVAAESASKSKKFLSLTDKMNEHCKRSNVIMNIFDFDIIVYLNLNFSDCVNF